ncbi:MAG: DNA repair protein RecO, partial [Pseudomonadota bacterium]
AATGATEGLAYVSPKSGRAVSEAGAGTWKDRLLPLAPSLVGGGVGDVEDVLQGLRVTGHFLSAWLAPSLGDRSLPDARARFVDALGRTT